VQFENAQRLQIRKKSEISLVKPSRCFNEEVETELWI
jgi:hypothetical protein